MQESYNLYYDTETEWAYIELDNVKSNYAINEQGVIINTITGIYYGSLYQILRPNGRWNHIACEYDLPQPNKFDYSIWSKIASLIEAEHTPKTICELLGIKWCSSNIESIKSIRKPLKRRGKVIYA